MTGLDDAQRSALERAVSRARSILEEDLAARAEGRFGIYEDGRIDDESSLRLDPSALLDRREIVGVIEHLRAEGESDEESIRRLIREAAFTHLNRLVAIRVAEAIELLPPSLADGRRSQGFRDVLEIAPILAEDETGGYWTFLRMCGDELAGDAPVLFDPRNPLLALAPSPRAVDDLLDIFSDPALAPVWTAPDTFGWTYQFFNTGEERRQMRAESGAPRNSRELAVRNQFFTPRYVVDFLVHNSLGRRLVESDPTTPLLDDLTLLIDPAEEPGEPIDLESLKILDPAVGSGHFLLGCYDVLERAWEHRGVGPAEAAPLILPRLWGIDIDPRCAQVTSAALLMRARRHCRDGNLPGPNIITARALPEDPEAWKRVLSGLTADRRALLDRMRDVLSQAPVLGPLLKVEEDLAEAIRQVVPDADEALPLFASGGDAQDVFSHIEAEVLEALQRVADETVSTASERLLAAEAQDAMRFVHAMRQRYDVVLMNPPFGGPVPETKEYLRAAYPWVAGGTSDLLATFVGRGVQLAAPTGYVGAITSRAGMFLTSFTKWREQVLLGNRLAALADLGHGVMEQALVEAAAYVIGAREAEAEREAVFVRLLKETDRPGALAQAIADDRSGRGSDLVFRLRVQDLEHIPRRPLAYWMHPSIRRLFRDLPPLEAHGAECRVGLQTSDDFRFVRAFWEVHPERIGRSRQETLSGKRWVPFAKGGEYSPYWADIHLLVEWENNGERVREFDRAYIRNERYYFRPGITWPERTASGFGPRILPRGCVFSHVGHAAFPIDDAGLVLAITSGRLFEALVASFLAAGEETSSGSPAKRYAVGTIQSVPWLGAELTAESRSEVSTAAERVAKVRALLDATDETTRGFRSPSVLVGYVGGIVERAMEHESARTMAIVDGLESTLGIEKILHSAVDLSGDAGSYLDDVIGRHPCSYRCLEPNPQALERLSGISIADAIDILIAEQGGSRSVALKTYFLDRRLEVLSHGLRCPPRVIAEAIRQRGTLRPQVPKRTSIDVASYLLGAAFGRWDVRIGRDPSLAPPQPDLFDPVPICSPGMLVADDGLPALKAPPGYPLELPPGRLLLDEPGHPWDILAAVRSAAEAVFDDPDAMLEELENTLPGASLRDYLRRRFFKDHLSRYSKSRRKAPIYWQLSVPSRRWGVWVYTLFLTRETLFAVAREAARREGQAAEALRQLQAERESGKSGRSAREIGERLAEEEALAEELRTFRAEAERIAGLGWEPDLDDGIILCAAPLADLFPAWRDAAKMRDKLRKGEYEWSTVAKWADQI